MDNPIELLAAQRLAETGLSAAELLSLDMADYARLTGRPTPTQAALKALDAQYEPPGHPRQEPAPTQSALPAPAPQPQGVDVSSLDMAEYAQLRGQLGMGRSRKEGVGLLNQQGTQSWAEAARAKSGRAAMNARHVVESPAISRAFLDPDEHRDTRTVAERFSNPSNFWTAS